MDGGAKDRLEVGNDCLLMTLTIWICTRLIGKRSIAQMTTYDLAVMLILANIAAEPLVYKINSKAAAGCFIVTLVSILVGWVSLRKFFYNVDSKPVIVIAGGNIDKEALFKVRINLPLLLSLLRLKGYPLVSDVEFAIIEPNGNLSVIPKSQARPVLTRDLQINTEYEGLALPLILDGEIQYNNLKYAGLSLDWLHSEIQKAGVARTDQVFLAELDTAGRLYVDLCRDGVKKPGII
jgi:uncharacterized membrane protein YcaP (DUF421 family)